MWGTTGRTHRARLTDNLLGTVWANAYLGIVHWEVETYTLSYRGSISTRTTVAKGELFLKTEDEGNAVEVAKKLCEAVASALGGIDPKLVALDRMGVN